jgi:hypothetical protein
MERAMKLLEDVEGVIDLWDLSDLRKLLDLF